MSDELRIDCVESGEARRNTPFSPSVPLSLRKQEALLRNMDSPRIDEPSTSSGGSTPSRKRLPLALRKNEKGETSLHTAARKGDVALCESLIGQGAVVNEADNAGWLPLHEACGRNQYAVAEFLVRNGADVNSNSNTNGDTPLHDACAVKNAQLIELLLRNGADRTIRNHKNLLPIDLLEGHVDGLRVFELDFSSSSSSSSSITTSPEREDAEDDEEDTPVPACRSSALISSEQPKDDLESQPSPSVSPHDTTFSISTPRRGAAARSKRAIRETAPTRQTRRPRGAKKATGPTRRGAPRNAARRGGASSGVYYADEDESALQGTSGVVVVSTASSVAPTSYSVVSSAHSSSRFLGKRFEEMSTNDESEKKRKEDVYEFRDDEEDDMPLVRFDGPSTSSSLQLTLKRKLEETKQDDAMKKVPPLRITLKIAEDAPQPEVNPEEITKEVVVEEEEEDDDITVIEVEGQQQEGDDETNQADIPSTSDGTDEGYAMRKNRGRPFKRPFNETAGNPEDIRVTRSRLRQAREKVIFFPPHKVRNRLRSSEYYIATKVATATVLSEGVTASQIMAQKSKEATKTVLIPIQRPKFGKVVRHIYQGNPARTYFTMENMLRKKMSYEHEKGAEVPPRPYSYKEHQYLCRRENRDITFWRRTNESKPPPKPVPEDCPPEMQELWKEIEEEQGNLLHEWMMEKLRTKSAIQANHVDARDERWRHEHGDYTVRPTVLTLLCRTFDPSMLEKTEKEVEVPTEEELNKWTADEIEKCRVRQWCVARIIYNKHKTLWEMDCKRFRLPKSLYTKRLNYFVPNLLEMVTPLDPEL